MFFFADSFNQDLSEWNVSSLTICDWMFRSAISFNQDISDWDMSNVTNLEKMFYQAESFNQSGIKVWNIQEEANISQSLTGSDLPLTFRFDNRPDESPF